VRRKVALVTGASRGIGKQTALTLAGRGWSVVLTARTLHEGEVREYSTTRAVRDLRAMPGSLEATAEAIHREGGQALPLRMDLLDRSSIAAAVETATRSWGAIDLLVNNAIYQGPGTMDRVLDLEVGDLERSLLGNAVNQLFLIQQVLPEMLARGSGVIVNLVSESAMIDPPAPAGEGGWGYG